MGHSLPCPVCSKEAALTCNKCHVVRYCSKQHQREHWKVHKSKCFPFRVESNQTIGRYLVASRSIAEGEVILSEAPLVVGPPGITNPICLGCNGPIDGKYTCDRCGFPLCGTRCPNLVNHKRECDMINGGEKRALITVLDQPHPMYQCITPLRCLWMKDKAFEKWQILKSMEAHLEERRESGRCDEVQNFIVKILRNYFQLENFEEEEIQEVCGAIETNGFEVPELNLVALYGHGYLLEHSCLPNTSRTFDARLHLVVTASCNIKAGEHITTSYIDPLWGERVRKAHLLKFKHFTCTCRRCLDPTELGTHLSSLKCGSCSQGLVISSPDITAAWKCNACGKESDAQRMEEALVNFFRLKESLSPSISSLEKYLRSTSRHLSENHHFRIQVKLALVHMYGKCEGQTKQDKISGEDIIRKRTLCNDLLEVANILVPGLSRLRGILLFQLHATYTQQFRRLHDRLKNSTEGKALVERAEEILLEALPILRMESHLKEEMEMCAEGETELKWMEKCKEKFAKREFSKKN